jgi:hypothetical protein
MILLSPGQKFIGLASDVPFHHHFPAEPDRILKLVKQLIAFVVLRVIGFSGSSRFEFAKFREERGDFLNIVIHGPPSKNLSGRTRMVT